MIRIAIGYVAIVALCAVLILLNPMDFWNQTAPAARLEAGLPAAQAVAPEGGQEGLQASSAAVLADLAAAGGAAPLEPAAGGAVTQDPLGEMSAAVLSALRGPEAEPAARLETLVAQALAAGQTDAAIDKIVNEAVAEGNLQAPPMLRTAEGRVDTAVLLAAILAEAQASAMGDEYGQGDLSDPSDPVTNGTLALQVASEDVIYTVQPGDSLGALALRFYGDASYFNAIYRANRQVLDAPESLRTGMRLLIPARSGL